MHQRSNEDTEDDGYDNDRKSPVSAEIVEELDDIEDPILKDIPHQKIPSVIQPT